MLPIRKVVLYKHGVGYFERQGKVEGEATVELHFKAAEMNDVLKSITLLDLNGGRISSVSYESTQPIQKQLENIALDLPAENALTGLLNQLKGARVRLEAGAEKLEGAVMGLEQIVRKDHTTVLTAKYLCLLVAGQGLRMVDVLEIKNLALLDESVRKDLAHLLEVLIDAKKKDLKKLTIFAKGEGAREIVAGYLVETPVWKTSYRVLLREQKSRIQGWALVDNTQEEDWDDVELTLVAGLPVSFVHDLYSPRYKRRPVVEVKEEEAYAPPQLEEGVASMAALAYAPEDRERGVARAAPMAGAGAPGTAMHKKARGRAMMDETRLAAAEASMPVQTRTAEAGDLFQYEIANAVTVKRSQSALVPILNDDFDGRKVAVYNPEVREKNPMSAVLFKNTTGLTLEGGPLTVLDEGEYVGESMLETLKPDDERILPYSVELGCLIAIDDKSDMRPVHRVFLANGTLQLFRQRIARKIYRIRNKTPKALDLFLEHRFNRGWDLIETPKPAEKTENFYRFRFDVAAKQEQTFTVSERIEDSEHVQILDANAKVLGVWLKSRYLDAGTHAKVEELIAARAEIADVERRVQQLGVDVKRIFENQQRVRENLKSLGTSSDEKALRERYIRDLGRDEDRLRELAAEQQQLEARKAALENDLRERIRKLAYRAELA